MNFKKIADTSFKKISKTCNLVIHKTVRGDSGVIVEKGVYLRHMKAGLVILLSLKKLKKKF